MHDVVKAAGMASIGIGKIGDIYEHRGFTEEIHSKSNAEGMAKTLEAANALDGSGLIMTNLVDFDMLYGHRRNPEGYRDALQEFDAWLPTMVDALREGDLLIMTADHGNDPTWRGSDHTRERVPIIGTGPGLNNVSVGIRDTFADIGETIAAHLGLAPGPHGTSFRKQLGGDA